MGMETDTGVTSVSAALSSVSPVAAADTPLNFSKHTRLTRSIEFMPRHDQSSYYNHPNHIEFFANFTQTNILHNNPPSPNNKHPHLSAYRFCGEFIARLSGQPTALSAPPPLICSRKPQHHYRVYTSTPDSGNHRPIP